MLLVSEAVTQLSITAPFRSSLTVNDTILTGKGFSGTEDGVMLGAGVNEGSGEGSGVCVMVGVGLMEVVMVTDRDID